MNEAKSPPAADVAVASAEAGHVILDGPPGLAATLSPEAAIRLGESLIAAAAEAKRQAAAD
ncbi:hypothetical protein [Sphingomonas crocodyli]|uniref:Uncharacterized protein n=1 Tax=Sphingomonas crocodyli TaxID=1979270 RepID=A0A437M504_9SPHN|nr:hypothetical protein [Sphingomonas crocodyli]RVT92810.1 hypothetical protein EOD43_02525 [Sphingomonas crocodyli]